MPMIIVSSLDTVDEVFQSTRPAFAISILDPGDEPPACLCNLVHNRHLHLGSTKKGEACEESSWCEDILALARSWAQTDENILVQCHRGVARSTAIAYILMCVKEDRSCEYKLAERLRKAAPHADPNILLISTADHALGRGDRMMSAILDMPPSSATVAAPVVSLPVAT